MTIDFIEGTFQKPSRTQSYRCPFGGGIAGFDREDRLVEITFGRDSADEEPDVVGVKPDDGGVCVLDSLFSGGALDGLHCAARGTAFQIAVWKALLEIPYGHTTTYRALAEKLERPKGARAVASAVGANRLAGIVPCHRVLQTGGGMGGYRWGVAVKAALLARERGGTFFAFAQ